MASSSTIANNNKRVARNTIMLYVRMIVIILANLYTTRVVLAALGETDYGIYNVVGGVVLMFSFISNSMTTTTQRYLSCELGSGNHEKLAKVFSMSLNIHFILALVILVLAETIGLWFLNTYMTIPPESRNAANWVYQISILTFCVNIIQVSYNAALIAHEKMNVFAYISILEAALKLAVAYLIVAMSSHRLIAYAAMVFVAQLLVRLSYQIYCKRHFKECHYRRVTDAGAMWREMTAFAGWNLLGSIAWLFKGEGIKILFNMFFGPVINAAQGIAAQVQGAIMGFVFNFTSAVNPQIMKYYASGDKAAMKQLTFNGLKYSYMLLLVMALPILLNINYILSLWLEEVPSYTAIFIILVMSDSLCNTLFDQPLMSAIAATGKIKWYQIIVSGVMLLLIPTSYFTLKAGYKPELVYIIAIIITIITGLLRFQICNRLVNLGWGDFFRQVLLPSIGFSLASLPLPVIVKFVLLPDDSLLHCVVNVLCGVLSVCASCWIIGLNKPERHQVTLFLRKKLLKR